MINNKNEKNDNFSTNDTETLESIAKKRAIQARIAQRKRDRMQAYAVMIIFGGLIITSIIYFVSTGINKEKIDTSSNEDSSFVQTDASKLDNYEAKTNDDDITNQPKSNTNSKNSNNKNTNKIVKGEAVGHDVQVIDGITYIDNLLIANKTYSLPSTYDPGLNSELETAFNKMIADAYSEGVILYICSGYRTYQEQESLYNSYSDERGSDEADKVSSRPGHSEHQTGLCIDVNSTDFSFSDTAEAKWLAKNCANYGFIIRYPEGKEAITGYSYESWHIRYVGQEIAKEITEKGICLEEYLDISSDYNNIIS